MGKETDANCCRPKSDNAPGPRPRRGGWKVVCALAAGALDGGEGGWDREAMRAMLLDARRSGGSNGQRDLFGVAFLSHITMHSNVPGPLSRRGGGRSRALSLLERSTGGTADGTERRCGQCSSTEEEWRGHGQRGLFGVGLQCHITMVCVTTCRLESRMGRRVVRTFEASRGGSMAKR